MYDPSQHAADLTALTQALLQRYLQRYWHRAVQAGGNLGDLFVTIEELSAALGIGQMAPPLPLPDSAALAKSVASARAKLGKRVRGAAELPAHKLLARTDLDGEDLELLAVLATIQGSPGLLRACTFAWADFAVKQPTAGFLVELLADDEAHAARLKSALAPNAALRRRRLLQLGEDRRWQPATPVLQRPAHVPESVCRFLAGRAVVGEGYPVGVVRIEDRGPKPAELILHKAERMSRLLEQLAAGAGEPVILVGDAGSGRRTVVRAFALGAGRALCVIDVGALPWELAPFERELGAAIRDGALTGAMVLLRCQFTEASDRRPAVLGRLVDTLGADVVLTATQHTVGPIVDALPHARIQDLDDGPLEARTALYTKLLDQNEFTLPKAEIAALVDTYRLRPGDLDRALRDVRVTGGAPIALDNALFDKAVRRQIRTSLSALASPVWTSQTWDDLIVEPDQRDVIDEILVHARYRNQVFDEWGFSEKLGSKGRGLSCLFSGPPGTGKTMTASLIAQELKIDLYQVDLSRIVDKYVGETEKNLAKLFDEASRVPVVLLFDEADSLFASRTKVESSNDRYANLEVNFLLQRMETYQGISILTTNLGTGIDQAFKRRLRFRLHFNLPGPDEREVLWKSMVPDGVKVAKDVDWGFLARRWEMSGAIIRNSILRAAFLAAAKKTPLTNELLRHAARSELFELGRLGS